MVLGSSQMKRQNHPSPSLQIAIGSSYQHHQLVAKLLQQQENLSQHHQHIQRMMHLVLSSQQQKMKCGYHDLLRVLVSFIAIETRIGSDHTAVKALSVDHFRVHMMEELKSSPTSQNHFFSHSIVLEAPILWPETQN